MNDEITGKWKRKLAELDEKVSKLKAELEAKKTAKEKSVLENPDLDDNISYLNDLAEFYSKEAEKYSSKLERLENFGEDKKEAVETKSAEAQGAESIEKNVQESFNFIFRESKEVKPTIKARLVKFRAQRPLLAYGIPLAVLALVITSLFLFKPSVVGYAVLSKETPYNESLSLQINESGAYEWRVKNPGIMKSLKASGSVIGSGTVKIYIEKGGEKHLIYKNK